MKNLYRTIEWLIRAVVRLNIRIGISNLAPKTIETEWFSLAIYRFEASDSEAFWIRSFLLRSYLWALNWGPKRPKRFHLDPTKQQAHKAFASNPIFTCFQIETFNQAFDRKLLSFQIPWNVPKNLRAPKAVLFLAKNSLCPTYSVNFHL